MLLALITVSKAVTKIKPCIGTYIKAGNHFHCQKNNAWCYKLDDKWVIGPDLGGRDYTLYRIDMILDFFTTLYFFFYRAGNSGFINHK